MKDREAVTTNGRAVFYAAMWNDLRQAALSKGWALALHGSLANDMDIMAMAWVEGASSPLEMVSELRRCFTHPKEIQISECEMPNNRKVFTLSIWADFYLDINVIQLSRKGFEEVVFAKINQLQKQNEELKEMYLDYMDNRGLYGYKGTLKMLGKHDRFYEKLKS